MPENDAGLTLPEKPIMPAVVRRFWTSFHNSIILALIFTLIGVGIGVKKSKDFYNEKMDEVIATGAMLHKSKVYTLTLKL